MGYKSKRISLWLLIPLGAFFLILDGTFFFANATKIVSGGWIVVIIAFGIFFMMKTWVDGKELFRRRIQVFRFEPADFAKLLTASPPTRVQGTAIFLTADPKGTPKALFHNLKHNRVLHKLTIILSIQTADEPYIADDKRFTVTKLKAGFFQVHLDFGFSETPDVPAALTNLELPGFDHNPLKITYFLGREAIAIGSKHKEMAFWRKSIFTFLFKNAESPADFFRLPADRIVEIGSKTEL